MAGDWIKMRHDLEDDPAVIALTSLEGIVDVDHAIGKLWKLWCWADRFSTNGKVDGVDCGWINDFVGVCGCAESLKMSHWLCVTATGLSFPKFNRYMSKNAKKRALAAIRQANKRDRDRHAPSVTAAQLEERRGEKNIRPPVAPRISVGLDFGKEEDRP